METITADIAGLVETLGREPAILLGHDWGAPIVWNTALTRSAHVRAVAGLSVPYTGVPERPFIDLVREVFTERGLFFYQVYFQDEGVAEAELEGDVTGSLRRFYYALSGDAPEGAWPKDKPHGAALCDRLPDPDPFPAWLSPDDIAYYVGEFEASGFRGPLNRYRNHERDFAFLDLYRSRTIDQPSLFIGGSKDLVLSMIPGLDMVAAQAPYLTNLKSAHVLDGIGHWTQQEAPEAVNALLLEWLKTI